MRHPLLVVVAVVVAAIVLFLPITVSAQFSSALYSCPNGSHPLARTTILKAVLTTPFATGCSRPSEPAYQGDGSEGPGPG